MAVNPEFIKWTLGDNSEPDVFVIVLPSLRILKKQFQRILVVCNCKVTYSDIEVFAFIW